MDMKEEMMGDSIDDVMEDEGETEEAEGDKILEEVLAEIGISVGQQVSTHPRLICVRSAGRLETDSRCVAVGNGADDSSSGCVERAGTADSRSDGRRTRRSEFSSGRGGSGRVGGEIGEFTKGLNGCTLLFFNVPHSFARPFGP